MVIGEKDRSFGSFGLIIIYHNYAESGHINGNYVYTRFEEFRTGSGGVLFTGENKVTASKDKSVTYIDIDELEIFKKFSIKNRVTPKTKTMLDRINNKISKTNTLNERLARIKADVVKKHNLIYEVMTKLQDEIYSDDPW